MTTFLPQDIAQLTSDAEFALKAYRTFERPGRPKPAQSDAGAQIHAIRRAIRQGDGGAAPSGNADLILTPADYHGRSGYQPPDDGRAYRALDALRSDKPATRRTGRKTTVALFASAGGCGVTTIAATLARLLSDSNESIALIDDTPQSLLGAYFGLHSFGGGVRTITHPDFAERSSVHIVNRPRAVGDDWVASACEHLDGEFDRMILDMSPMFPPSYLKKVLRDAVAIVPLLPDLRTACRLEPMLKRLIALRDECDSPLPIYFLLSQFDPQVRLHCEIGEWLQESFRSLVLPLTLRRGDEISEALADGGTVIDYAPSSGIALDYRMLAAWIQQLPPAGPQE